MVVHSLLLLLLLTPASSFGSRVWAWGNNQSGQCNVPAHLTNAVAISAKNSYCLALTEAGIVVAWGNNTYGQCNVPAGLSNVVAISAGSAFALALRKDGTVVSWGYAAPEPPSGLTNVIAVSAGEYGYALALRADGSVVAWGREGPGTMFKARKEVPADLANAVAVVAGQDVSTALTSDGTVRQWGDCASNWECDAPAGATNIVFLSPRGVHMILAITADGRAIPGWGYSGYPEFYKTPGDLTNCVAAAVGDDHALVLRANGQVTAWGQNGYGQCNVPEVLTNVVAITAGNFFSLALVDEMPPRFASMPSSRNVAVGSDVRLTARVEGSPLLSYQWFFQDEPITGATNSVLVLTNVQETQSGYYKLVASNLYGSTASDEATVRVLPALKIHLIPSILVEGGVGSTYLIEYMNTLDTSGDWLPLGTISLTNTPQYYPDYSALGQPKRMYRAVRVP